MFEIAELGKTVSKEEFNAREPQLRCELVQLQHQLKSAPFSPSLMPTMPCAPTSRYAAIIARGSVLPV